MKIAAVIVTYSNRFMLLEKVIESLHNHNINKIIIVNNNSSAVSRQSMQNIQKDSKGKIKIVDFKRNTGSAVAFNKGIEEAFKENNIDFVWLLDDDNYAEKNSLKILISAYSELTKIHPKNKLILSSFRTCRKYFYDAVKSGKPELCVGTNNIFRNFNILDKLKKIIPKNKKPVIYPDAKWGEIGAAAFGGMFFHRSVLESMGKFDETFILYCDDVEFGYRVKKKGGITYCILDSKITDLEDSWNTEIFAPYVFATFKDYPKFYYDIRNRVYFEKKYLVTNWLLYITNMIIYLLIVYAIAITHANFQNIKVFTKAVYHGLTEKMGYNENYPL